MSAMQNFMSDKAQAGGQRYDRDGLFRWSAQRIGVGAGRAEARPADPRGPGGFHLGGVQGGSKKRAHRKSGFARNRGRRSARSSMEIAPKAMPAADIDEIDAKLERGVQRAKVSEAEDAK